MSFKEAAGLPYSIFDINKTGGELLNDSATLEVPENQEIQKIKEVRLYPGKVRPEDINENQRSSECVGGMLIVYKTKSDALLQDGLT